MGGFSGASIASIITAPIDIIKTSVQVFKYLLFIAYYLVKFSKEKWF